MHATVRIVPRCRAPVDGDWGAGGRRGGRCGGGRVTYNNFKMAANKTHAYACDDKRTPLILVVLATGGMCMVSIACFYFIGLQPTGHATNMLYQTDTSGTGQASRGNAPRTCSDIRPQRLEILHGGERAAFANPIYFALQQHLQL